MKYANILFDGNRAGSINLGDDMQIIAIENIYKSMGIDYSDVVRIPYSQLKYYDGDYVILPISFPLYGYNSDMHITMFSKKIIPVFLGLSIMSGKMDLEEISYLKQYEPIGCRDCHTMLELRKNNILSYVGGCMTALFPQRQKGKYKNVYLVDIPEYYKQYIPKDILTEAIVCTQIKEYSDNPEEESREMLEEYCNNAKLVITTRLHCAMPCVACGIPVIVMKEKFSFRFTSLAKYIHVYTKEEFSSINWNPSVVDYEEEKKKILLYVKRRIIDTYNTYSEFLDISASYETSMPKQEVYIEHVDNVIEYINSYCELNGDSFKYAIWGITQKSELIYQYISINYPKAKLSAVYDRKKNVKWHGLNTVADVGVLSDKDTVVFVTAATANNYAVQYFSEIGKSNYHISDDGIEVVSKKHLLSKYGG